MKRNLFIILFGLIGNLVLSQRIAPDIYWFYFTDKSDNNYSINKPQEFLSQRSIDRRAWQGLSIDESDLPVSQKYIDSISAMNLEILFTSKWLNGVLVKSTDSEVLNSLYKISFIDSSQWSPSNNKYLLSEPLSGERFKNPYSIAPEYQYGMSFDQIDQLNLQFLHEKGYTGNGVMVAILDAGYKNFSQLPSFQTALASEQIVATKNFVNNTREVYSLHSHGTNVSSIIMANWPDTLIGGAPDVSLLLAITEDVTSETRVEEFSWIAGAEWADSIGADIFNTSLGYTTFDDSTTNYTYEDMDGKTAFISIANGMTAAKGIISVTSAGNSGNEPWHYIGAPADAFDILSVGAVDNQDTIANFSSRGPSYDHRIKPEISAMGYGTAVQSISGDAVRGSGTSFASPMIAGATAVLWQAYPRLQANELIRWIIDSGDHRDLPDVEYGYGIPDFKQAFFAISPVETLSLINELKVYPNPFKTHVYIDIPGYSFTNISAILYDIQGRIVYSKNNIDTGKLDIPEALNTGVYFLEISADHYKYMNKIIKN